MSALARVHLCVCINLELAQKWVLYLRRLCLDECIRACVNTELQGGYLCLSRLKQEVADTEESFKTISFMCFSSFCLFHSL